MRLPPSVVTGIMAPVITGMAAPIEERVNDVLDVVAIIPLVGETFAPLDTNASGLLAGAAGGAPITLQVYDSDGNPVDSSDQCNVQADSISLANPRGIEIGGNRISGLGANGAGASAGEIDSIAFGNNAQTGAGADGAVAIGTNAQVSAANSVAIGAGSTASRGPQLAYAALGLDDDQVSAGEFSVGAGGAERQITHVAAGSADTDAVNVAQLQGVADDVAALAQNAVQYDGPARDRVTLAGTGGTVIDNVAPGAVAAGSMEAVNGDQLFATNQQVAALDNRVTTSEGDIANLGDTVSSHTTLLANHETRITALEGQIGTGGGGGTPAVGRYSDAATPTLPNAGTPTNDATLVGGGAGPVALHNVAEATLAAGSTDAVNGGQLFETNQQVADNSDAISVLNTRVDNHSTQITNLNTRVNNLDVQVDSNTNAITNLTNVVNSLGSGGGASAAGPMRYSDAATPTTPNSGAVTNHATLVGSGGAAVTVHNVAGGTVAQGSTDAVNGGQLHTTNQAVATALALADEAVTAAGVAQNRADQAVTVANAAAVVADEAITLAANSVQYDPGGASVTLGLPGGPGTPVVVQNVAPGVSATDAVNVSQLNTAMQTAVAEAAAYTDMRIDALNQDLTRLRRDANGGTANALAAAALPQAMEPGRGMVALGMAHFQGQSAFALGLSTRLDTRSQAVLRAGATVDTRGRAGANAGLGIHF